MLKLYSDAGSYSLAVLPENSSVSHFFDAAQYTAGVQFINGDRAEEWLGRWAYDQTWNADKLKKCPDLLKKWNDGKHVNLSNYSGLPAGTMPATPVNRED